MFVTVTQKLVKMFDTFCPYKFGYEVTDPIVGNEYFDMNDTLVYQARTVI